MRANLVAVAHRVLARDFSAALPEYRPRSNALVAPRAIR